MKKIFRVLLTVVLAAVMVFALTACKSDCEKGNHTLTDVAAVNATCTTEGNVAYKHCDVCGKNFAADGTELANVVTPATGHTLTNVAAVAATCTTEGVIAHKHCSVCEKNFALDGTTELPNVVAPIVAHVLNDVAAVGATCTSTGNVAYKHCSVCEQNFDADGNVISVVVIDKVAHALADVPAVAATCTSAGNIAHKKCSECQGLFNADGDALTAEDVVVAINADAHAFGTLNAAVPATCTAEGTVAYKTCSLCEKKFSEAGVELDSIVAPIVADAHVWGEWAADSNGTSHTKVCTLTATHTETKNCDGDKVVFNADKSKHTADCSVCGRKGAEVDHTFVEGACACGVLHTDNFTVTSFADLATAAAESSKDKFFAIGRIESIANTSYGNLYIQNEDGEKFYVYGLYSADGTVRFDKMETKPAVGDVVVLYGKLSVYNSNPQYANAWLVELNGSALANLAEIAMAEHGIAIPSVAKVNFELDSFYTYAIKSGDAITIDGANVVVSRPAYGEEDKTVVITVTKTVGTATASKDITITVPARGDIEEAVLTPGSLALGAYNTTETIKNVDVDWSYVQVASYGDGIQTRNKDGKQSIIYNKGALSQYITGITFNWNFAKHDKVREDIFTVEFSITGDFTDVTEASTFKVGIDTLGESTVLLLENAATLGYKYVRITQIHSNATYTNSIAISYAPCYHKGEGVLVETPAKAATCLEAGLSNSIFECKVCGKLYNDAACTNEITAEIAAGYVIPALNHDWNSWVADADANTHSRICKKDSSHVETVDCTLGVWVNTDAENHWKVCEVCSAQREKAAHTDPVTCTVCGRDTSCKHPAENFVVRDGKDGTHYTICSCGDETTKTTPVEHDLAYTSLADGANHSVACGVCDYAVASDTCTAGEIVAGETNHTKACTLCQQIVLDEEHTSVWVHNVANCESKCSVCEKIVETYEHDLTTGICAKCGDFTPAEGVAYKLGVFQGDSTLSKDLYFDGKISGTYLPTVVELDAGHDVFVKLVDGGFNLWIYDSTGAIKYLNATLKSNGSPQFSIGDTAVIVWSFEKGTGSIVADVDGTKSYIGTYNTFNTLSVSKYSFLSDDGVTLKASQYPAYLVAGCQHKTVVAVAEQDSTCTVAGWDAHYKCEDCGKLWSDETHTTVVVPARALAAHVGGTATCDKKAVCTVCSQEYGEFTAHTKLADSETEIENDGVNHNVTCSVCEQTYTEKHDGETSCTLCGWEKSTDAPAAGTVLATFGLCDDDETKTAYVESNKALTTFEETVGSYTLTFESLANVYNFWDENGNGGLKLGSSSKAGSFSFTVPAGVNKVYIYVAGRNTSTGNISINGGDTQTINKFSTDGYTKIEVNTSETKTVSFTTVSGGWRVWINTIEFVA